MNDTLDNILFDPIIGKLITVAVGIILILVLSRFIKRALIKHTKDNSTKYRFKKLTSFISYVLIAFLVSVIYFDKLGGLTVALGVAGAGIAFALQEVIASVAGWMAISFAKFFKIGDRVELGGIKGDVIDIGILRTTIMECGQWINGDLYNGRVVRIANSFVFKAPVFNYSGDFPFLWDEITLPVRYGSNIAYVKEILNKITNEVVGDFTSGAQAAWDGMVEKFMIENASVEPLITFIGNDNWLEFTVRYVVDYKRRRITKDRIFTRIMEEVEKSEGKIALASATFELVAAPSLKVKIQD
ncbi:MAG: transporter [Ignavibacteriae bacterium HGW-Ignavibacteriae-3]|nr:MAG: transporter [Ignavibacteriae bacterium HGW-Ignavibacteriae-3]